MPQNFRLSLSTLVALFGCGPGSIQLGNDKAPIDTDSGYPETGDTNDSVPEDTGHETGTDTGVVDTAETGWVDTGDTGDTGSCTSTVWYADADGDGYGNVAVVSWDCTEPLGYVSQAGDYDDTDATVRWSPCQQTLVDISLESLWTEEWEDLTLTVNLSADNQFVSVHWYDSTAPMGVWLACATVSALSGAISVSSDTSVTSYYGNTYDEYNTGAAEDWNQYLVTDATRSDGTAFSVSAYSTEAELTAIP
ncbi:MAG: hypothetical protein AAB558_02270 [Patescibacteria group bacterium]